MTNETNPPYFLVIDEAAALFGGMGQGKNPEQLAKIRELIAAAVSLSRADPLVLGFNATIIDPKRGL
jgi:hypothetical protein